MGILSAPKQLSLSYVCLFLMLHKQKAYFYFTKMKSWQQCEKIRKSALVKLTISFFFVQGISLSPFGGLCSYPYQCMAAPAANFPAPPTCSSTSALARNSCFPQSWSRYSPYLIPTSVNFRQKMHPVRLPNGSNSQAELLKSGSRVKSSISQSKTWEPPLARIVTGCVNELQNTQNLVRGLDKRLSYADFQPLETPGDGQTDNFMKSHLIIT